MINKYACICSLILWSWLLTVIKYVSCKRKLFPQDFTGCTQCVVISDSMCSYHCVCGKMYHSLIWNLNMNTDSSLFCSFTMAGKVKGTQLLTWSIMLLLRKNDWTSGCLCIDIRKAFQLGVAFVIGGSCAVDCIFQAGRDKSSLMIRRVAVIGKTWFSKTQARVAIIWSTNFCSPGKLFLSLLRGFRGETPDAFCVSNTHLVMLS